VELYLIRHGEPEWVLDGLNIVNPPLTERGHRQAAAMAGALADEQFNEVLVSPLTRARQTAAPLLAAQARDEVVDDWLEEIRSPLWQGTPREKADAAFRDERRRPAAERWAGLDGGEPVRDFVDRIHLGATLFLAERGITRADHELPVWKIEDPDQRIVLVAHAGVNSVVICHLLGLEPTPWEWERFVLGHASISRVEGMELGDGWTFCLTSLGGVEHIAHDDRTR
jgi:probable phosphoglycerate mutase